MIASLCGGDWRPIDLGEMSYRLHQGRVNAHQAQERMRERFFAGPDKPGSQIDLLSEPSEEIRMKNHRLRGGMVLIFDVGRLENMIEWRILGEYGHWDDGPDTEIARLAGFVERYLEMGLFEDEDQKRSEDDILILLKMAEFFADPNHPESLVPWHKRNEIARLQAEEAEILSGVGRGLKYRSEMYLPMRVQWRLQAIRRLRRELKDY